MKKPMIVMNTTKVYDKLLETWMEDFSDRVGQVQDDLTTIDSTGHFEADDEVGSIFNSIKDNI